MMSICNSEGAKSLTQDERILHHHAAIIKRDLEAYHAYSRSQEDWKNLFKDHLVRFILVIRFVTLLIFTERNSMNFYVEAHSRNSNSTIRVHPLLLSLTETIDASETNPDISTISENDERALGNRFYTSPSGLPPLEMHFSGQCGPSLPSNQNGYPLTSVAGCQECMASASQYNLRGEENAAQGNLAATFYTPEDNLAHMGGASLSSRNKGKRRPRTSSGGAQGSLPRAHGPKAAGAMHRAKGKPAENLAEKAGSWDTDTDSSSPEANPDKSPQEGRDWDADPRMFIGVPV
jgi:hypothetical protein